MCIFFLDCQVDYTGEHRRFGENVIKKFDVFREILTAKDNKDIIRYSEELYLVRIYGNTIGFELL